jgi:tetratricopeptide (TPR) repeat protein
MKRRLEVCALAASLAAGVLFAQTGDWQRLMEQGQALARAASYGAAAAAYREALRIAEPFGSNDRRFLAALNSLALAYEEMGRFSEAQRHFQKALSILDEAGQINQPDRALLLINLALLYQEHGQAGKSEAALSEEIAMGADALPPDDVRWMPARAALAELLLIHGRSQEAERLLQESLRVFEKHPEHWQQQIGIVLGDLGVVRQSQGRNDESEHLFLEAVGVLEAEMGPRHPLVLRPLINLAQLYAVTSRRDNANATFRRAIAIAEQSLGAEHPTYGHALQIYAAFLRSTGRKREAKALEARSKNVLRDNARRDGVGLTVDASAFRP